MVQKENKMGEGTDAARSISPIHAAVMDNLKDQLLLVFLRRLGGKISIPLEEIDNTDSLIMTLRVDKDSVFHFELKQKE